MISLSETDIRLLNRVQNNFPICHDPFTELALELALDKSFLIARLKTLQSDGVISRFGGVINHQKAGKSTLAALKVPPNKIDETAELVNAYEAINHNYLREHEFNLWFVVTGSRQQKVDDVLESIRTRTGYDLISLPMVRGYHIDLAFKL